MKTSILFVFAFVVLSGCAASKPSPKAIFAVAKHDRYAGINASRDFFRADETPCVKISGYGGSTFSYRLYKEGMLERIDAGNVDKVGNNDMLTCWKNLPGGFYKFQIYDSSGTYVDTIEFRVAE